MPKNPHPCVSWRDGRPRFQPSRTLRARGFAGTDLRWPAPPPHGEPVEPWDFRALKPGDKNTGRWFSKGEAVDWSAAFTKSLKPKKARTIAQRAKPAPAAGACTVGQLFSDWWRSPKFQIPADPAEAYRQRLAGNVYAAETVAQYKIRAGLIERFDPELWAGPVDALTTEIMFGFYEEMRSAHGIASARYSVQVLSAAFAWGRLRGKFKFRMNQGVNPARGLKLAKLPPRVRVATRHEIETLVAAADAIGRPEIGDSILLGLWTGQRQGDRIALTDKGLLNGRRVFRQSKTGAIVAIREAPSLRARLAAAEKRRRAARAAALLAAGSDIERRVVERRFAHIILDESENGRWLDRRRHYQPFARWNYSHVFGEVRAAAVAGIADGKGGWQVKPCESLADFQERDIRDTAVTWQALAGSTIPEIISLTGHSIESAVAILKHYLARDPAMADAAIRKMVAWYDAGGETELGL